MNLSQKYNLHWIFFFCIVALLGIGFYLWISYDRIGIGYPLDDAWIHQTYARNLVEHGEWSFIPGKPSAGSTAPLWSALISLGLFIGFDHFAWTYFIGSVLLVSLGWITSRWFAQRTKVPLKWAYLAGIVVIVEWHLLWAALSGMETLAFASVCLMTFYLLEGKSPNLFRIGILIGVGVWIRPGALTLLLPVVIAILINNRHQWIGEIFRIIAGFVITFVPYLLFNFLLTESVWPNTFYAKQAEYLELNQLSLFVRYIQQLTQPIIGVGFLIIPGIFIAVVTYVRQGEWVRLLAIVWVLLFLGTYALQLPVTYQHGRYAIPTIPIVLIFGLDGMYRWIKPGSKLAWKRIISRIWVLSSALVLFSFVIIGGSAYSRDVGIIETEMVAAAKWIDQNLEQQAILAAHDIGALGYFGNRDLIDLAGLVSPEVILFIRDEYKLARYLDQESADYLMTFPAWYPNLVREIDPVYISDGDFSPAAGGENMVIYRWEP